MNVRPVTPARLLLLALVVFVLIVLPGAPIWDSPEDTIEEELPQSFTIYADSEDYLCMFTSLSISEPRDIAVTCGREDLYWGVIAYEAGDVEVRTKYRNLFDKGAAIAASVCDLAENGYSEEGKVASTEDYAIRIEGAECFATLVDRTDSAELLQQ